MQIIFIKSRELFSWEINENVDKYLLSRSEKNPGSPPDVEPHQTALPDGKRWCIVPDAYNDRILRMRQEGLVLSWQSHDGHVHHHKGDWLKRSHVRGYVCKYRRDPYFTIKITTDSTKCLKMIKLSNTMHNLSYRGKNTRTNMIIIVHLATLTPTFYRFFLRSCPTPRKVFA